MRLVTRGNFDGLCCAVLIQHAELVDRIELIHPQDITDSKFEIRGGDILANLPYHPKCAKWFDHHSATRTYEKPPTDFDGSFGLARSTARLVFEYYRHENPGLGVFEQLVEETDRFDSADLTMQDVTDPKKFILLAFTMDPRTGLGSFEHYFSMLVDEFQERSIDEIMQLDAVQQRVSRMNEDRERFLAFMKENSRQEKNVIVTDLRDRADVPTGNRFLIYTLYPDANVWLRIAWGPNKEFVVATVGHSIFNRTCPVHVGGLLAKYGGGGHKGAGATPISLERADEVISELIHKLSETEPSYP